MKILISTGIYPPKIGGPAQYSKNLKESFEKKGHHVALKTFDIEDKLPTGIRHLYFFLRIIPSLVASKAAIILDTYSVGFPTVLACKIFGKKGVIRTGGDFLWEQYVERTGKKILLSKFYETEMGNLTSKEKIIYKVSRWTLRNASHVIFSTDWQRRIFLDAYGMQVEKTSIVENYYGPKEADEDYESKIFVGSARNLVWKNFDTLKKVFAEVQHEHPDAQLFLDNLKFQDFMRKMRRSYAIILVSLGDISPNMILDAIRFNRPFICTREVGTYERIKHAGIFVDPLNPEEIKLAVLNLLTEDGYKQAKEKVKSFDFTHTWDDIADEFLATINRI